MLKGQSLYKEFSAEFTSQPFGLRFLTWQYRLIHQVVAEDRRAVFACSCNSFPENGLRFPAILFTQVCCCRATMYRISINP